MAPFGIKVSCIEPGFFQTNVTNTGILKDHVKMLWGRLPADVRDDYGDQFLQSCGF